ncbi:glycosyltransferase family 2 protein [Marisediminicola senii]|uniref:glycosyltransferase family 2 protein n=1 Tax=Marisediminicola senii TaxID=2711233 RepID=UPI0013EC779E|nr:glycosyltransferase family 2 protein [Marisediminicola senii]
MTSSTPDAAHARVAVVTVSFGSSAVLGGFLESVAAASIAPPLVVVADNKPTPPNDVAELTALAGATYLPQESNRGYGGGINAAVAGLAPSIDWVLISNPDVVLHDGMIDALLARGDSDPRIGAVGPAIYTPTGELYPSARTVPSLRTGVGHALFANIWLDNPWTRAYRNDNAGSANGRDAGWLSGACLLVRRSAFDEIGGFDPGFFMYFEDVDLGYRLGKAGYRSVYEPLSGATHSGAHSTTEDSAAMVRAHHDSARRFLGKKYAGPLLWPVRVALGISLSIRSAIVRRTVKQSHHH